MYTEFSSNFIQISHKNSNLSTLNKNKNITAHSILFFLEFHQKTTLVKNLECPECQHPVPVTCLGGHETSDWPCAIAKSAPCGRKCGRSLACENHTCDRDCHKVKNAPNDLQSGTNCR